ncbi:hypothetical protein OG786_20855 [Streptomyces sp. NBC_00101]|uniref:hypothetical protein n=1 Tax=Streptomyces sp. NBC_00101 TaxID=2975651 RepID=UPI00324C2F12
MRNGKPWVGDQVRDEEAGRDGVITDVQGGTVYVLRALRGPDQWKSRRGDRLTVVVPLQDQIEF